MPAVRSRSLLTAVVVAPLATSCFLSGDYKLKEKTVVATGPASGEEATSSAEALPSEVTPAPPTTPPTAPQPAPPTTGQTEDTSVSNVVTVAPETTSIEVTSTVEVSTAGAVSSSEPDAMPTSSEGVVTSEPAATSQPDTDAWPGSDGNWWDSSDGRCWQGNCTGDCANGEVQGPEGRCYWFGTTALTWTQTKAACTGRGVGWVPIAIHNEQEDGFISSQINHSLHTWLGAQYAMGTWRWMDDNTTFWNGTGDNSSAVAGVFSKWGTNEPSGSPGETCSRIQTFNSDMRWGDSECNDGMKLPACQSPIP